MNDVTCKKLFNTEDGKQKRMVSILKIFRENKNVEEYVKNRYSDSTSIKESVYRISNNIEIRPQCRCGKVLEFDYPLNTFHKYCCSKCQNSDPEKIKKDKKTKLDKYGSENYNNFEKMKETCYERYGTTSFTKTNEFIEKTKKTNFEKYGVDWWLQTDTCKDETKKVKKEKYGDENYNNRNKAKKTSLKKYGVPNTKQWKGAIEKDKDTCLKKYGVTSYAKTDEFKEKLKATYLKKWGVDNCTKSEEWKNKWYTNDEWVKQRVDKIYNTMLKNHSFSHSKPEQIILNFLKKEYPDTIYQYKEKRYPFKCDFYIPSKDLFIEYNGYWAHGEHFFDKNDEKDIEKLKTWKEKSKKSKQYENAIKTWTVKDPLKLKTLQENNLNHIILWYDSFKKLDEIKEMVEKF